ncbi:MAG: hypothetical protein N2644_04975 [Candidatus Sumerlaea chitinivorans]|nr:hypothetical protein [Candidatus Sumerlaea chitinivorans]
MKSQKRENAAAEHLLRVMEQAGGLARALQALGETSLLPTKKETHAVAAEFAALFRTLLPAASGEALEALVELCVLEAVREHLAKLPVAEPTDGPEHEARVVGLQEWRAERS